MSQSSAIAPLEPSMLFPLHLVAEVAETRSRRVANDYLSHGYVLVAVQPHSSMVARNSERGENPWVRRAVQYVLARTADVPHYDAPLPAGAGQ